MSVTAERVGEVIAPTLAELSLHLYDLEYEGGVLRVWIDRDGGLDVNSLTEATRRISVLLDEQDPIASAYTLEVSSPGLERRLRTPEHFAGAIDAEVKIKTRPGTAGARRCRGVLRSADDRSITVVDDEGAEHVIPLGDIDRAQTVFDLQPAPKPGGPKAAGKSKSAKSKSAKSKSAKSKSAQTTESVETNEPADAASESDSTRSPTSQSEASS